MACFQAILKDINNIIDPQFSLNNLGWVSDNQLINASINFSSYVFPINSIIKFDFSSSFNINNQLLNNNIVKNKAFQNILGFSWVPAFNGPVKSEFSYRKAFFSNRQMQPNNTILKNANNTDEFTVLLRSNFSKKVYLGVQYNFLKLVSGEKLNLLDVFFKYNISSTFNIDLTFHNLTNKRVFRYQYLDPNVKNTNEYFGIGRYVLIRLNYQF